MPGTFTYGLYPFPWDAVARCHAPPAGSECVLDLRPLSEQAKASQSGGYGLFAWASGAPGDLISLGTGYAPELLIDNAARNELRIKLGLASNPSGATLADAMADVLGALADPTGASMAKPIMPTSDGTLELHLSGHSRIWSAKIDAADVMSASSKGRHNRIRDVIRADLDEAERIGGAPMLRKCLGAWLLKLGVSREELKAGAGGRKAQYDRLMSAAVKAKHGANARPEKPETQLVELWPSNGAITSGQTYTWAETVVSQWVSGSAVSSNKLGNTSNGTYNHGARCTTPLSSADHWSQGNLRVSGNYQAQLFSRMAAAAETGYAGGFYGNGSINRHFLTKYVSGTATTLSSGSNIAPTLLPTAALGKMRSNGSTQSFELAGFSALTVTDPAITGNLFGGAGTVDAANNHTNYVGPVTIDDGLSGGGSSRNPSSLGMLGVG